MEITAGRIVLYTLSADDATQINRRRTNSVSIAERLKHSPPEGSTAPTAWPRGAQAHIGNETHEGDVVPMIVARVWPNDTHGVNGQAFLDGNDTLWVTSVAEGTGPHTWAWPPRV
jgi:hypothetical protein